MTRRKIKGKKSSNPTDHFAAGGHPNFHSLETISVDNDHCEDGRSSLTNALNSDQMTLQRTCSTTGEKKRWGRGKHGPAASFAGTCSIDHQQPGQEKALIKSAFLFNQDVIAGCPSPRNQLSGMKIGRVDWLEQQALTIVSRDEEHASPHDHGCDSAMPEEGNAVSTFLRWGTNRSMAVKDSWREKNSSTWQKRKHQQRRSLMCPHLQMSHVPPANIKRQSVFSVPTLTDKIVFRLGALLGSPCRKVC